MDDHRGVDPRLKRTPNYAPNVKVTDRKKPGREGRIYQIEGERARVYWYATKKYTVRWLFDLQPVPLVLHLCKGMSCACGGILDTTWMPEDTEKGLTGH